MVDRERCADSAIDRACEARNWPDMATRVRALSEGLPPRLELLARAILDLLDDHDFDLAVQMWGHLREAASHRARLAVVATGP